MSHQNSLIFKRILLVAFDAYLILFYLAFYEQNVMMVCRELVSLFNVDTVRRIFLEGVVPFVSQKVLNREKNTDIAAAKKTDEVIEYSSLDQDIK